MLCASDTPMDDFTAEMIASGQDNTNSPEQKRHKHESSSESASKTPRTGLRGGIAAIRERASIQDRLVEK